MGPIDMRQIIKKLDTEDFSLVSGSVCSKLMLEICENMTVRAAILDPAVRISDIMSKAECVAKVLNRC